MNDDIVDPTPVGQQLLTSGREKHCHAGKKRKAPQRHGKQTGPVSRKRVRFDRRSGSGIIQNAWGEDGKNPSGRGRAAQKEVREDSRESQKG